MKEVAKYDSVPEEKEEKRIPSHENRKFRNCFKEVAELEMHHFCDKLANS